MGFSVFLMYSNLLIGNVVLIWISINCNGCHVENQIFPSCRRDDGQTVVNVPEIHKVYLRDKSA